MDSNDKLKDLNAVIAFLAEQFPACFTTGKEAKPLKIGIFKDLAERLDGDTRVSRTLLRQALRRYTSSWKYLRCVEQGGQRVDLDGNECGELEQEHIDHAKETLAESRAKFLEKKKEQNAKAAAENKGKDKPANAKARKDNGRSSQKPARFNNKDRRNNVKVLSSKKAAGKISSDANKAKESAPLNPVTDDQITKGSQVKVKVGKAPVPGTITDINKGEIHVQLKGGIVIKTSKENLFSV